MGDDITATVAELSARGAIFRGPVEDQGFGPDVLRAVPGADDLLLYQPQLPTAFDLISRL